MRILGFDTATPATAVALWDERAGLALEARDEPQPGARPGHVRRLLPQIAELLERGHTRWEQVDRIAVGVGPGTFTGIRIAIATARALSQARSVPLVGISTLQALALGAQPESERFAAVLAVLDARRGEAFAASWRCADVMLGAAPALIEPQAVPPAGLRSLLEGLLPSAPSAGPAASGVLAVGDGAIKFREILERSGASIPEDGSDLHRVSALSHCRLAGDRTAVDPDEIRPAYLRLPDAEISRRSARTE